MQSNPLFRPRALERLSSPERLDALMQVTSPKGWLALYTIAGLLGLRPDLEHRRQRPDAGRRRGHADPRRHAARDPGERHR